MTPSRTRRVPRPNSAANPATDAKFANLVFAVIAGYAAMLTVTNPSLVIYTPLVASMVLIWTTQVRRIRIGRTEVALILWSLFAVASSSWSLSPSDSAVAISTQLGTMAIFLLVRAVGDRSFVLVGVAVGFLIGCLRKAFELYQVSGFSLRSGFGADRADLVGLNQNYLAYCMTLGLLLIVWLWRRFERTALRVTLIATAIVLMLGINVAGTRASLIGVAAFFAWLTIAKRVLKNQALPVLTGFAAFLGFVAYTGAADGVLAGQVQAGDRDTGDLNGRLGVWQIARQLIYDDPWTGIGAGAFRAMNPRGIDTHNAVLEVAVGTGLLGLTLFAAACYLAIVADTRALPPRDREMFAGGLIVLLLPILLSGHWYQAPAMWVVIAFTSRLAQYPAPPTAASPRHVTEKSRRTPSARSAALARRVR